MTFSAIPPVAADPGAVPCPGCGALFPDLPGPTHPYIGASAGCWALFSTLNAGLEVGPDLLTGSSPPIGRQRKWPLQVGNSLDSVLVDAYAVQHHGDASRRAVQSVAIHLLTLYGLIERGMDLPSAVWLRKRAAEGTYSALEPPPLGEALTVCDLFEGARVERACSRSAYVQSVYGSWMEMHRAQVEEWWEGWVAGG